jgi:hypothetical protein
VSLARELISTIAAEVVADPDLARELADALAPHLTVGASGGWLSAQDAADYLGLGSLDALDRLVRDGLPCAQPNGPGGRRYFHRPTLDGWMAGR